METVIELFRLIKQHEYDKFKQILSDDTEELDVNIKDESSNYLIHYAILFNRKDLVTGLINRGARLDVTDIDGRSIIHIAIKYNYNELLSLLLHFNNTLIGISLVDIRDFDDSIPLHYAIMFRNLEAVKILLEAGSDVEIRNKKGNNGLHLAIYSKHLEIIRLVLDRVPNINTITGSGETPVHLACNFQLVEVVDMLIKKGADINIPDAENELTPLAYAVNLNNHQLVLLLIKHGADINHQDLYGNSSIHYAILEDNLEIFLMVTSSKATQNVAQFNLQNIDGSTPLHLALGSKVGIKKQYLDIMIPKTHPNIQDNYSNSCLHLLCKTGHWVEYYDTLKLKKLQGLLTNSKNQTPIDLVGKKHRDKFIHLLAESYLNTLRTIDTEWLFEWENVCGQEQDLTKTQQKELDKLMRSKNKNKNRNEQCVAIITDTLQKRMLKQLPITQPLNPDYKSIIIKKTVPLKPCLYTGISLDIVSGLIMLCQKHPQLAASFSSKFATNTGLINKFQAIGYRINPLTEFTNFEIIWMQRNIHLPIDFDQRMVKLYNNPAVRFICIPIGIHLKQGTHANVLLYDKKTNEMERFEPNGSTPPYKFNYNDYMLDYLLRSKLSGLIPNLTYVSPRGYLPRIGFQYLDAYETDRVHLTDPDGFCAVWTAWYIDQRLSNPDTDRKKLVRKIIKTIKRRNDSFKEIIRGFSSVIVKFRDQILVDAKTDINRWVTGRVDQDTTKKVVELLQKQMDKTID